MSNVSEANIEEAVEKTLIYYKLFNSGISLNALHSFLLDQKVSKEQLDGAVKSLVDKKIVLITDSTIYLNKEIDPFYERKQKTIDRRLTNKILKILERIPFISAIAFSGGTANYGIDNHEDIDLFIITKPYTVYLVYFIIHVSSLLLRSRKIICVNYLIDERDIDIRIQRDLFTAHQIIALKPFKNENFLHYFLNKNDWVKEHYPNFVIPHSNYQKTSYLHMLLRPLNFIFYFFYRFMYKKYIKISTGPSVVLSEHIIKLHTNDYHSKVINEFQNQWSKYIVDKNKISFT